MKTDIKSIAWLSNLQENLSSSFIDKFLIKYLI